MNLHVTFPHVPALTVVSTAAAILGMSACAAATPAFNPDNLPPAQISRVAQACENVMGLSPSERLVGGQWLGDSRLDYWTSRYRGCMTSLSDSIQKSSEDQASVQADHDCRAKGYATGSPDLALCVLQTAKLDRSAAAGQVTAEHSAEQLPAASGSLFYASAGERRRREELACASVGIEALGDELKSCVNDLQSTFHAIDTPIT